MLKKIFLGGVVMAVVLLVFGFVLFNDNEQDDYEVSDKQEDKSSLPETNENKNDNFSGVGSLKDLMSKDDNLRCDISYSSPDNPNEKITGTYFVSLDRTRGDFVLPQGIVSSIIIKDNTMYTWSLVEGELYGMKADLDLLENKQNNQTQPGVREPIPRDVGVGYDCKRWNDVDSSVFEPPADVLFKDYEDLINTGMEYGTSYEEIKGTQAQCSACSDLSTESERRQCRESLRCQ